MTREILLIDDDADELEVFTDALNVLDKNIHCTQMKSLAEGHEFLTYSIPGYIFIDFNMPKTNGLESLSELKKNPKLEKTKIILYSNHISEEMKAQAIALGAYDCIKKPNTILALSQKLREILKA